MWNGLLKYIHTWGKYVPSDICLYLSTMVLTAFPKVNRGKSNNRFIELSLQLVLTTAMAPVTRPRILVTETSYCKEDR